MNSQPSSSPSSIPPTFQENGEPAQFLDWVQERMSQLEGDPGFVLKDKRNDWVKTISSVLPVLSLPSPAELPWHTMHEQIKLTEVCLQLTLYAAQRVPSLFAGQETLAEALFTSITILCTTLDLWIDVDPPPETGYLCPAELYTRASITSAAVLQAVGDEVIPEIGPRSRQLMRAVIDRCAQVVNELLSVSEETMYPLHLQVHANLDVSNYLAKMALSTGLNIASLTQVPLVLSSLLEICMNTLTPTATNHWFISDVEREIGQLAQRAYDYLFFSCTTAGTTRLRAVARMCTALTAFCMASGYPEFAEIFWTRMILFRLENGPDSIWDKLDASLTITLRTSRLSPRNVADLYAIARALQVEDWTDEGNSLRELCEAYIMLFVPSLEENALRNISALLNTDPSAPSFPNITNAVNARLRALENPDLANNKPKPSQRDLAREAVQAIVEPHVLDWMDDDGSLTEVDFIRRALDEISRRFEDQPVWNTAPTALEGLAKKLGDLPCLLFHAKDECVPDMNTNKLGVSFIAVYFKVAFRILEGDESHKIHPQVSAAVYGALAKSFRHQTSIVDERLFEDLSGFVCRGMKDGQRAVRLAAGRTLIDLTQFVERLEDRTKLVDGLFQRVKPLLRSSDNRIRETTIVTVGLIGKACTGPALRESACLLVFQLGQNNPILKGTAMLQLQALARQYNKSLYNLTSPYLDRIAPHLVGRLLSEPDCIAEFCRLLSITLEDFVNLTLKHSLPRLFADANQKVLEAVSTIVGKHNIALLVLDGAHYILSYSLMLMGLGQTNKGLTFILNVLRDNAHDPSAITIASVARSCLIHLLTEIVVYLGDSDPDKVVAAQEGLRKLVRLLGSPGSEPSGSREDIEAFFKEHMLGVISTLNDMLQEVHGRQTVETKQKILRSFGEFAKLVGPSIANVAPQFMASLQTMVVAPQFSDAALSSWYSFISTLNPADVGSHVGPTSASLIASWGSFSLYGREMATRCLHFMIVVQGASLGERLAEVADLSSIPELHELSVHLAKFSAEWTPSERLGVLLERLDSESLTVAIRSAIELKAFLLTGGGEEHVRSLATGDVFDPLAGHLVSVLYRAACRDGEGTEALHELAFECIGIVGAIDPDRFELRIHDHRMIMTSNFADEAEATTFALHLIQDLLVGAFRSTSDIKYQSYLGYAIQELLKFCKFTPALVNPGSGSDSIPIRVRNRWNSLPKTVLETVTPLLESRFNLTYPRVVLQTYPIYPRHDTYRQWVQVWTSDLIYKVKGDVAKQVFQVFTPVVRNKDVGVAHHLLPHLVLTVLASGDEDAAQAIRTELLAVLSDQVDAQSTSSADKKLLSAQTVFMLLDHLNKWIRIIRQDITKQKSEAKRSSRTSSASASLANPELEEALLRVDSILASIDQGLMAKAAFQCKAYSRSLMNLEQQIVALREQKASHYDLQDHYERLHEMYAHLDQPDGMEGISTMILSPSLEHQIRQHESTGRWTSAQSCWEVRLQHEPDNLDYHLGLLTCLRNLGHYDSLRTHVKGVLIRNPEWGPHLVGYQVESEWMVGHWEEVQNLVSQTEAHPPHVLMAQVLLAMRSGDDAAVAGSLSAARKALGTSITASGPTGYRRSYDAVLDLHLAYELEVINKVVKDHTGEVPTTSQLTNKSFKNLLQRLAIRFDSTLPSFRIREPILNMRRTAFNLSVSHAGEAKEATGKLWLNSAKIARKAGHSQTAYSAILQAQRCNAPYSFIERTKLIRGSGEPLRALQELENAMKLIGVHQPDSTEVIDLTDASNAVPDGEIELRAKAHVLHARWMADSGRFEDVQIHKEFSTGANMVSRWESGEFHLGQFHDECFKSLTTNDKKNRGQRMNLQTIRCFTRAIRYGSKYIYQTLPRILTIWLDMAEAVRDREKSEVFTKINAEVLRAVKSAPAYKWYTVFPQAVSRIGLSNETAYGVLQYMLSLVIQEYPRQALWLFTAVAKSTTSERASRSREILSKMANTSRNKANRLISSMTKMTDELLALCKDTREAKVLHMPKAFAALKKISDAPASKDILIPLQESLTANLPPLSASENTHQPFPLDAPRFNSFFDEIEIMSSLAKPKKLSILGSNGQVYTFLGKRDDLRKDGRLMDFNDILNKLLRKDSDSRRRQLNIRTYGVVSLNEEAGLIQWVPNTIPIRPILHTLYVRRGRALWAPEVKLLHDKAKAKGSPKEAAEVFTKEVLPLFPPVLHEWFIETFSEPSLWLASRTAYSRTAAVMSMVGYILGLGDRHCENILLDTNSGDVIHVDFDCLFEKGQALETPEIVPFRLTHNIVDGFGVTGVEGFFRIACEATLRLLRENTDCLMNVLDAFVHDPLVEWVEKRRRSERTNEVADVRALTKDALGPIKEKLQGIYRPLKSSPGKQLSTNNHVQALIQQASDPAYLARMYVGWAPFH